MKKKIIPVLLAIVLIFLIISIAFGAKIMNRFTYSKERADLISYFQLENENDIAIVLQDERIDEKAKLIDGVCYFDLATVQKYFTDRFYVNTNEQVILYTTDTDVITIHIGDDSNVIFVSDVGNSIEYKAAVYDNDVLYIAADYVKKYVNFSYELFDEPLRMQVYTNWDIVTQAKIKKNTSVRYQGGIKSKILCDVAAEDTVTILEEMDTWTKVKTQDAFIGYVENKVLSSQFAVQQEPVTDAMELTFHNIKRDYTINMGFHQVFTEVGANELKSIKNSTLNVIAPTWFRLTNSNGDISSIANASYVQQAHADGMEVWAVVTDVDTKSLYDVDIDYVSLFSSSANRRNLINQLLQQVDAYGIDGINIDFEKIKSDSGTHFVQFLRELSIETRKKGIVLSVDNYVPTEYTAHYNRKEQGLVVDYIVVMGYDEFYNGCGEAGPNASINYVENGIEKTKNDVPAQKIINAIPFYTRVWENDGNGWTSSTVTMNNQKSWIEKTGVEPVWLDEYCQNYIEYESNGKTVKCWLEDEESIRVKLQVMKAQNIAGVAEWKLGIEDPSVWNVIGEYMHNE